MQVKKLTLSMKIGKFYQLMESLFAVFVECISMVLNLYLCILTIVGRDNCAQVFVSFSPGQNDLHSNGIK